MRATILANEAFQYNADLNKVTALPGTFHLAIRSTWAGAKDAAAEQVAFQACVDRAGLLALRDLIDQVVAG
jgi:hypothetical protein